LGLQPKEGKNTVHHSRPWLDIHYFDTLPARGKPAAFELAARIARSLAPDLARLNW